MSELKLLPDHINRVDAFLKNIRGSTSREDQLFFGVLCELEDADAPSMHIPCLLQLLNNSSEKPYDYTIDELRVVLETLAIKQLGFLEIKDGNCCSLTPLGTEVARLLATK